MISRLSAVLFLCLLAVVAPAAQLVTVTVTITNNPAGNTNSITVNSSTRTWTNTVTGSPGTLVQQTNTTALATTNLLNHLTSYRVQAWHLLSQGNETNLTIRGRVGEVMTVTIAGGWAAVTYATNTVTSPSFSVRLPITVEAATNQTNIASMLVTALERATNSLSTNNTGLANYVTKGASALQEVTAPALFSGGLRGSNLRLTNGFTSATTNINPVSSNLVNYGNAIRSEGSGGNSLQLGSNAVALSLRSVVIGNSAVATNTDSMAIGTSAKATNTSSIAIGVSTVADGVQAVALGAGGTIARGAGALAVGGNAVGTEGAGAFGNGASASGTNSIAIGNEAIVSAAGYKGLAIGFNANVSAISSVAIGSGTVATHSNSVAIGAGAATTTTNEIRLGSSSDTVSIPGRLAATSITNATLTGTNHISGDLSFGRYSNTSIVNGNNAGIVIGTNVIVELSGGTTIAQYAGFSASRDGDERYIRMSGPVTNIIVNEVDVTWSTDGTAARRIVTGTGASLALTNAPSWMRIIYRAASSRWEVSTHSR